MWRITVNDKKLEITVLGMAETVEKPDDRSVDELLAGLKKSIKQAKEGKTRSWKEVKEGFQQKQ